MPLVRICAGGAVSDDRPYRALEILLEILLLDGDKLVSHGPNAVRVRDEARRQGMECPFVVRSRQIPAHFLPDGSDVIHRSSTGRTQ